jgi:hypothetical protein
MTDTVFAVQDETGTVAQLTLVASPVPAQPVAVGDTGVYAGYPDDGTALSHPPTFQSLTFKVGSVLNPTQFTVQTTNANMADWPANGTITWQTGANALGTSVVTRIDGANAYLTEAAFRLYHSSRGTAIPAGKVSADIQTAIVKATDYLDQKYRFSGVKLLQRLGSSPLDVNAVFLQSWLTPYAVNSLNILTPSTSTQTTEWPRQGVVDLNGNTVNGIPKAIQFACAELAMRVLQGTNLQPDYDPKIVSNGGVVSSITKKIGPLETTTAFDTKLGLGFFASFPQINRMLSRAGLLRAGGSRTVIR